MLVGEGESVESVNDKFSCNTLFLSSLSFFLSFFLSVFLCELSECVFYTQCERGFSSAHMVYCFFFFLVWVDGDCLPLC